MANILRFTPRSSGNSVEAGKSEVNLRMLTECQRLRDMLASVEQALRALKDDLNAE